MTELVTMVFDEYTYAQNAYALAVTPDGTVYVYETYSDYICTVDLETGLLTKLNSTSRQSVYGGSDCDDMAMTYDPITGDLYLLMTSNNTFYRMFKFDPDSNALTNLDKVGEVIQINEYAYSGDTFAGLVINAEHTHAWDVSYDVTEPNCTEPGHGTHKCLICGEVETYEIDPTGHSYESVVVKPTETEQGYTEHTCTVCGHSYKDNFTDPDNAPTGDAFQAAPVLVLMTASVMGLAVLVLNRKKFVR